MLPNASLLNEMNSSKFSFIVFILAPLFVSLGRSHDISFSICWMAKDNVLERQNGNIWLNNTSVKQTYKEGKLTSLSVSPAVETKLTLQYGGFVQAWTFRITPSIRFTQIKGIQEPEETPTASTKEFLDMMTTDEVFACENGTVFFHQDENFFLAIGHTQRHPVRLDSRTPSSLLVSWVENGGAVSSSHTVTLYHTEQGSYKALSMSTTTNNNYHFTALSSCSSYMACVETADTHSLTCLSALTDPDVPRDFKVSSMSSRRISLSWKCPKNCKYSLFLLTAFFLNGTDHVTEEMIWWHKKDNFVFTLSNLEPCRRVKFGLQTVCQAGAESHYSGMVLNDGNSAQSSIEALRQTSFGPDNYTLSWQVKNTSSISKFRVYHQGVLQGSTLLTNYTIGELQPCQQYQAQVEALCGDSVIMSTRTVLTHTGPNVVSELRYRSKDSTALWTSSTLDQRTVAFLYELSLENGPTIQSSRVTDAELHLSGLKEGKTYVLDVWEECEGEWESERSRLCFQGANSSSGVLVRAAESAQDPDVQVDLSGMGLTMVLPWSLPEDLHDDPSEPRDKMEEIFKDKLEQLLKNFSRPVRIEIVAFEPADEWNRTEVLFMSFDASKAEDVPLSVDEQLGHISSLRAENMAVTDGVILWEGPDLCVSSEPPLCPRNAQCINTLGSYMCVCKHGFYDVSSVFRPAAAPRLHCNEKGLFSQCMEKLLTGGIAKPYLTAHMGGRVDVQLNDGRCTVEENEMFFFFQTSRKSSECGTERRVNRTHMEYQNTLAVSLTPEQTISRRDLKVVWKCVYPRHYIRNAQVGVDMEWLSSLSLVEFNSSAQLGLTMALFKDLSFTNNYTDTISLEPEDTLFFQVSLQTKNSFASSDVLLQVDSCWATETMDPQDAVQGLLIQDGCPVDHTLHWLSVNGAEQQSRFSVQMFSMPQRLPIYIHCLANICGPEEDCTKNCTGQQRTKRSVSRVDGAGKRAAVVSAGPLLITRRGRSGVTPSYWAEHVTMICVVSGSIGFLFITVLSVSATKAIMTYYERLRLQ